MTLVVPFDGSELAEAALVRATEFAVVFEENVLAVSVVPKNNAEYARERGWLGSETEYDLNDIVGDLHQQVTNLAPQADFRHEVADRHATPGTISNTVRKVAKRADASMVFVGSENAGRLVTGISSVGGNIATDEAYDVVIVRDRSPAKVAKLKDTSPHHRSKSDFYAGD